MMRALLLPAGVLLVAGAMLGGVACSSFTTTPSDPADAGTASDGAIGPGTEAGVDGGPRSDVTTLVQLVGSERFTGLAVHGGLVYYTTENGVFSLPSTGGQATPITSGAKLPKNPVANDNGVYWCDGMGVGFAATGRLQPSGQLIGGVCHAVALGASGTVVATYTSANPGGGLVLLDAQLSTAPVKIADDPDPFVVATRRDDAYWTSSLAGQIKTSASIGVARTNGSATVNVFQPGQLDCESIAASDTGVFWANMQAGQIVAYLFDGKRSLVIQDQDKPRSVAADTDHVYWRNEDGTIYRADFSGAFVAEPVARSAAGDLTDDYRAVALSDTEVFWLTADGKIQKTTK